MSEPWHPRMTPEEIAAKWKADTDPIEQDYQTAIEALPEGFFDAVYEDEGSP